MPLLTIADSFYIGVLDIAPATSWYIEKFGAPKSFLLKWTTRRGVSRWASPKRIRPASPSSGRRAIRLMGRRPCCTLPTSRSRESSWVREGVNVGRGSEGRYACDLQRVALPPLRSLSRGPPRDPSNRGEQRRWERCPRFGFPSTITVR
jgi:hypothetical protein